MFSYVFYIVRWLVIADFYLESMIKRCLFKTYYIIEGDCNKCGKCCEVIGVVVPDYLVNIRFLLVLVITFYEKVNDFKYQEYSKEHSALLFYCNNFDNKKQVCTSYNKRPAICRSYPSVRYFNKPKLLPTCSYEVVLNKKKKFG